MAGQSIRQITGISTEKSGFLSELYKRFGRKLLSYAMHTWNMDEDEAWNLIYDTLYKVTDTYERYTFASEEKFGSFVFTVFINLLRNHHRDNRKKLGIESTESLETANSMANETAEPVGEKVVILREELEKLEDWQRILLLMRSDGRSYAEIARYVHKPEDQLKVYYQRLKKHLTQKLHERY